MREGDEMSEQTRDPRLSSPPSGHSHGTPDRRWPHPPADRSSLERELEDTCRRFSEAQALAHVGCFEWDTLTDEVQWTRELYRIFGLPRGTHQTYESFLELVHPDDRTATAEAVFEAVRGKLAREYEHRIVRPDGGVRTLHSVFHMMSDERDRPRWLVGSCQDVTELVEARHRRQHAISLLEATIDATSDGILVVDLDGNVTAYNRRFIELWRIPKQLAEQGDDERLLAHVLDQLEQPTRFLRKVHELYRQPERESFDVLRFKDGRVFERFSAPQRLEDEIVGRVWSFHDSTQRERAERQAREVLGIREAIGLLAIAAHDVRNPLAGLSLQLDVMQNTLLGKEVSAADVEQQLDSCRRFVNRASALLRSLLEATQVGTGKLVLHAEQVDLAELTREIVRRSKLEIENSRCEVTVRAEEPVVGRWDRDRLDQIITNLLSNALKYGKARPVEIEVGPRDEGAQFEIRDHGIGMSPEQQERAFRQFERCVAQGRGVGLGLWIARKLVTALGGQIELESRRGAGSTFTVSLPWSVP